MCELVFLRNDNSFKKNKADLAEEIVWSTVSSKNTEIREHSQTASVVKNASVRRLA